MIGTQTQQSPSNLIPSPLSQEESSIHQENAHPDHTNALIQTNRYIKATTLLLSNRAVTHHPKAGLNPLVDAAGFLFTVISELKYATGHRQLNQLQLELIKEVDTFQETISHHAYNAEYLIICRYVLCATLDDIITNTPWGGQGQWDSFSLLAAFNQDTQHQSKFFTILDRALKDPSLYIDLMEFIYICLSTGYKGQYRSTEHSQYQLEQITNNLYKHIRAYRGSFSKTLSPTPLKTPKAMIKPAPQSNTSLLFIFFMTACIMMTIFIGLDYLMDVISNEAYKNLNQIKTTVSNDTVER